MAGLRARRLAHGACLIALIGALGCERKPDRLSVCLFMLDAARADHFGVYGYERETTPAIDAFAHEATVFEAAFAEASSTFPSVAALMTGELPVTSGLRRPRPLPAAVTTLAERAKESGYRTYAFSENPYISTEFAFDQGFDRFDEDFQNLVYDEPERETSEAARVRRTTRAVDDLLDWMDESEQPFFAYLHLLRPHNPYIAPPSFRHRFGARPDIELLGHTKTLFQIDVGHWEPAPRHVELIKTLYDENLSYVDSVFGRLWTELQRQGLHDRTIVVVTADHGEAFGEHERFLHGTTVYDEMIHVPLISRHPRRVVGHRSKNPVQLTDLSATLLEVFGWKRSDQPPRGQSLLPVLTSGVEPERRTVFSWAGREPAFMAARSTDAKVIFQLDGDEPRPREWFDLKTDPGERRPRTTGIPTSGDLAASAREMLDRWQSSVPLESPTPPVEQQTIDRLRALGYAEE